MVIANPIYDTVFKQLMENERVAKFFIGTLLEQTVESIEFKPQEFTYAEEIKGVAVFRVDFIATIKTQEGGYKKVLIEIQKVKDRIDLMRFRKYLAKQYGKEDTVNNENITLPITTIYILGFKLPEIDTSCLKVERNYRDLIARNIIHTKSEFVENLTHDSFIVQVNKINGKYQTKLDKLLSLFEQKNFVDDTKITKEFNHEVDIEELKIATDILHYAGTDPKERKKIEVEQEAWRSIDALFEKERKAFENELAKKDKTIDEKEKMIDEKEKTIDEMAKKLEELERRLKEK